MSILQNGILCFIMVAVITVRNAGSQDSISEWTEDNNRWQADSSVPYFGDVDSQLVTPVNNAINGSTTDVSPSPAAGNRIENQVQPAVKTDTPESLPAESAIARKQTNGLSEMRWGIGFQCGIRFHKPEEFNNFVTTIWNAELSDRFNVPVDKKSVGPGVIMGLNGTIDFGTRLSVSPFVQGMWAGKQIYFRGGEDTDVHINAYTAMGGLNLWCRIINRQVMALRLGIGGYATHTIARITGDAYKTVFSGSGFGCRGLVGTEVRLRNNVVVTLDCGVPFGKNNFCTMLDRNTSSGYIITYPDTYDHFGFEVCPGIMFYF